MSRGPDKSFDEEAVVAIAMREFWRRGYSATSMENLRTATGLGAKSLYDTYGNKRDLFLTCIDYYGDKIIAQTFDDIIAANPPKQALKKIVRNLVRINEKGDLQGCLLGVTAAGIENDPELSKAVQKYLHKVQAMLADLIGRCEPRVDREGERPPSPTQLASMLMVLFQGIHIVSRAEPASRHVDAAGKVAVDMIDRYL